MSLSSICGYCSPEKAAVTIQRASRKQKVVKEFQALERAATTTQARFRGHQLRNKQLLEAAESGDIKRTKNLLARGANINARNNKGSTALHIAVHYGHREIVEALVNAGADINAKGRYGMTALHWAADNGSEDIVKALVRAGADVNVTDRFGFTALHWAADKGCEDIVQALVIAGADLTDNVGWRIAIKWAKKYGHYDKVKNAIKEGKKKLISLYKNEKRQVEKAVTSPIQEYGSLTEPLLKNEPEKLNETQREQARKYIEKEEQSNRKEKKLGNINSLIKNTFASINSFLN